MIQRSDFVDQLPQLFFFLPIYTNYFLINYYFIKYSNLERRNDAVSTHSVGFQLDIRPFGESSLDSWSRLGVGLTRCVSNRLLELSVLPLLSVPQHSRLSICRRDLQRWNSRFRRRFRVRIRYLRYRVPLRNDSDLDRRG